MKSNINEILFVISILIFASAAFGQSRQVTAGEIDGLVAKSRNRPLGNSETLRISKISNYDSDSEPSINWSFTAEFVGPDRSHTLYVQKSGNAISRSETIQIGKVKYLRKDEQEWRMIESPQPEIASNGSGMRVIGGSDRGMGMGSGSGVGSFLMTTELSCQYLGKEKINGTIADLYQKVETVKIGSETERRVHVLTNKYWFNKDGRIVREILEDGFKNSKKRYTAVTDYEYDSTIKIEAPIK